MSGSKGTHSLESNGVVTSSHERVFRVMLFFKIWLADSIYFGKSCSVTYYKQTKAIFKLYFVVQIFKKLYIKIL